MIKALGVSKEGRPVVILGLNKNNVHRLTEGQPIFVEGSELVEHGGPNIDVAIVYGDSYEQILADFKAAGVEIPE